MGWNDYLQIFSPGCNNWDPGKAGLSAYYVIESLKNCIIYIQVGLARLTEPARSVLSARKLSCGSKSLGLQDTNGWSIRLRNSFPHSLMLANSWLPRRQLPLEEVLEAFLKFCEPNGHWLVMKKERCTLVLSRSWIGALSDDTNGGCEGY